jgi:hypothetical protein
MNVRHDPDASLGLAGGFGLFAVVFVVLLARLYRPLVVLPRRGPKTPASASPGPAGGAAAGANLEAKRRAARIEQQLRSSR